MFPQKIVEPVVSDVAFAIVYDQCEWSLVIFIILFIIRRMDTPRLCCAVYLTEIYGGLVPQTIWLTTKVMQCIFLLNFRGL